MPKTEIRKEMPGVALTREQFSQRMQERFTDPAFEDIRGAVEQVIEAAWQGYSHHRKAPHTQPAGAGFADPEYQLAIDWIMPAAG